MIEQSQVMPMLLTACPSFRPAWEAHVNEYGEDLLYISSGDFADHLFSLLQSRNTSCFPAVAAVVEKLHTDGSPWVKEFATIGILEDIQNVWGNRGLDPEVFSALLGTESQKWWRGLNNFWSGKAPFVSGGG